MTEKFFKVLKAGQSVHGGNLTWSLPNGDTPGEWHEVEGEPVLCSRGLHLTDNLREWWTPGAKAYEAEVSEDATRTSYTKNGCKIAVSKCRLVRELAPDELIPHGIIVAGVVYETKPGETIIVDGGTVTALGNSNVTALGNSNVTALGNSKVTALENSNVTALGNSKVTALGNSKVTARGNSNVTALGNSKVTARGNSKVTARGNSKVTALGNSKVDAAGAATIIWLDGAVAPSCKEDAIVVDRRTAGSVSVFGSSGRYGEPESAPCMNPKC